MNDAPNDQQREADASVLARLTRTVRRRDFAVLGGVALAVLAGLALIGQLPPWIAVLAAVFIAAFCVAYYFGTVDPADPGGETIEAESPLAEARRKAEVERQFRRSLIEALPEPAMYIDPQGRVEAANPAARKQFRIIGADPLLTAVVRKPEMLDAVAAAQRSGEPQRFEFIARDETDRYLAALAAPLAPGVLVSMHDITDIKRAEFARVDFLANASHELRTPLTSLAGFIETLRGPAREDPEARDRFLEIMHSQAERMRRLISDLLSLSRIELIEHRPPEGEADLAAVAAEAGDALLPVAKERGVRLRILGQAAAVSVTGIKDELAQVAQNLIDNAIKYSDDGGVVEIEVLSGLTREEAEARAGRRWDQAGHMSIVAAVAAGGASARFAVLRVSDAGPGIERQYLPRLSERFYRVDPGRGLRPGTGLGLAIVKHVVQRHRGEFLVESEPGRGSAFGVVLPMSEPQPSAHKDGGAVVPDAAVGRTR
jgi:two-component system, OmpR family, phosphate regulon sensor histidine kinase PhoR